MWVYLRSLTSLQNMYRVKYNVTHFSPDNKWGCLFGSVVMVKFKPGVANLRLSVFTMRRNPQIGRTMGALYVLRRSPMLILHQLFPRHSTHLLQLNLPSLAHFKGTVTIPLLQGVIPPLNYGGGNFLREGYLMWCMTNFQITWGGKSIWGGKHFWMWGKWLRWYNIFNFPPIFFHFPY